MYCVAQVGRQVFYRANPDCPVLPELTGLLCKTVGLVDALREGLQPLADRIDAAYVVARWLRATCTPTATST